jgi:hypothetical protein
VPLNPADNARTETVVKKRLETCPAVSFAMLLLLVLLLPVVPSAEAGNKYVRAGATGAGTGADWANAYPSLPATLTRGDTYYIADGTYNGYLFDDPASGTTMITLKKATVTDHGTATGWSDAYGDGVATFTGSLTFKTPYYTVDGQVGGGPAGWKTGHGFKVDTTDTGIFINPDFKPGAHHITVRHLEYEGVDGDGNAHVGDGIFAAVSNDLTFSHMWIHDVGNCIYQFNSVSRIIIEYSYTGDFHSQASSHAEISSTDYSEDVTFRWNVFTHVEGTGGLIFDSTGLGGGFYIYGNVFYQDNHAGDWIGNNGVIGAWSASAGSNILVYNNTFINIDSDVCVFGPFGSWSGNQIRNNLFYTVGCVGSLVSETVSHNHFVSTPAKGSNASTASGNPFVNYLNFDFALGAGTPAGFTLPGPYNVDMFGRVRGADGTWDRGAVEFDGASVPPPAAPRNLRILTSR